MEQTTYSADQSGSENTNPLTRRRSLKLLGGTIGGASVLTSATGMSVAEKSYQQKEKRHDQDVYENGHRLELDSTTSLGYLGRADYGDGHWYHKFDFSTTAGCEFNGEEGDAIAYHELLLDGDSPNWEVDFFEDLVGVKPTNKEKAHVVNNLEKLAGIAVRYLDPYVAFGVDAMETWKVLKEMFDYEKDSKYTQKKVYNRGKQDDITPHRTKQQGQFEIRVDKGDSGWVTFDSTTEAWCNICESYNKVVITTTNEYELWIDDTDVSIYENRY